MTWWSGGYWLIFSTTSSNRSNSLPARRRAPIFCRRSVGTVLQSENDATPRQARTTEWLTQLQNGRRHRKQQQQQQAQTDAQRTTPHRLTSSPQCVCLGLARPAEACSIARWAYRNIDGRTAGRAGWCDWRPRHSIRSSWSQDDSPPWLSAWLCGPTMACGVNYHHDATPPAVHTRHCYVIVFSCSSRLPLSHDLRD